MKILNTGLYACLYLLALVSFGSFATPTPNVVDVKLNDNVKIVNNSPDGLTLTAFEGQTLSLAASPKSLALKVGDVLVSDVNPLAPNGYLKMIKTLQVVGDQVKITTRDANLNELYAHGRIHVSTDVSGAISVASKDFKHQVSTVTNYAVADDTLPTSGIVLPDGDGYYRLVFSGSISDFFTLVIMKVKPRFEMVWEKEPNAIRPKFFKSVMHLDVKDVSFTGLVGFAHTITLAELELPPLSFFAGVPVVFRNKLSLQATGSVFAGGSISGGMLIDEGNVSLGTQYVRNVGWDNLSQLDLSPTFKRPTFEGSSLGASLIFPKVNFQATPYGVDNFQFFAALQSINSISYDTGTDVLNVGGINRASAGVKASFLGFINSEFSYNYDFLPYTLYEGTINGLGEVELPQPTSQTLPSDQFSDIQDSWAFHEIRFFIDHGYFAGYPDKTFRPQNRITRAEFIAMLGALVDTTENPACADRNFSDIDGHWAKDKILAMARACWTAGYPDGTFRPNNNITRQEMYAPLVSQPGLTQYDEGAMRSALTDDGDIADWAVVGMSKVFSNRIMVNYPDPDSFRPNFDATRAEVSAALYRLLVWRGNFANPWQSPFIAVDAQ